MKKRFHLDIEDVEQATGEVIVLASRYMKEKEPQNDRLGTVFNNARLHIRHYMGEQWKNEMQAIEKRDILTLYHVCRQDQEERILTYGIYHDSSPTLTLSLVGAVAQAELYQMMRRDASILKAKVPVSKLVFQYIDLMGPGFLPAARKTREEIPNSALPYELVRDIFESSGEKAAWWLDPAYFDSVAHRTSPDSARRIIYSIG